MWQATCTALTLLASLAGIVLGILIAVSDPIPGIATLLMAGLSLGIGISLIVGPPRQKTEVPAEEKKTLSRPMPNETRRAA